ncbi:S8 family serine peptidase [Deinococcus detaillensis]|uniref:S8 family serine peptidase n=1 Tax=Deinococcus detaillensis TaxID=2592048 RepID=A0A553UWS7_9DEIO|nr:S8 family serine peptidase [Deinococcus detaillensis]TSA84471.1 S8 family serine peptidase [Deinococcus detaillensis]
MTRSLPALLLLSCALLPFAAAQVQIGQAQVAQAKVPAAPISQPAPKPIISPVPKPVPAPKPATPAPTKPVIKPALPELAPLPAAPKAAAPLVPFSAAPTPPVASPITNLPLTKLPTDPLYPQQWNLNAINMAAGWAVTGGQAITVAVLDTGYVNDPELSGRLVNGYDFVSDAQRSGDGDGRDYDASGVGQFSYHGEGVANIIAAAHDNQGMAGINPVARILAVRVAGEDGLIAPQDLIDGLRWAAGLRVSGAPSNARPAKVINLSLYADFIALSGCDARIQKAVDEVTAKGVLIVAGAANDAADAGSYSPAGCRGVLTVAATNRTGWRASYSNYGASVALSAPGGEPNDPLVFSSVAGEQRRNGTSFAAPQVAGVASLVMGLSPKLTPAQVISLLERTAKPFAFGCDANPARTCGAGLLDAGAALRAAQLESRQR